MSLTNTFPAGSRVTTSLNEAIPIGVRYEQRASQTAIVTSTDTKAKFDTAVETNSDVTASGTGNTDFLLNRIGRWHVAVGMRYLGNAGGGERHVYVQTGSTFDQTKRLCQQTPVNVSTAPVSVQASTTFHIAAATTIIVGLWQNAGSNIATDVAFGGANHIALTWLGP